MYHRQQKKWYPKGVKLSEKTVNCSTQSVMNMTVVKI